MNLTEEQKAIINCEDHCFVLASAGSGKTSTIAEKIRTIKLNDPFKRILYITFTRKAKQHAIEKLKGFKGIVINNYHGIAYQILSMNKVLYKIKEIEIVNDAYCISILQNICKDRRDAAKLLKEINMEKFYETPYSKIKSDSVKSGMHHLEKALTTVKKFTFADLIVESNKILRNNTFNIQTKRWLHFDYIFVDEFQDNYPGEYSLVSNIQKLSPHSKITAIGDVVQSVYSFLGAVPALALDFIDTMSPKLLPLSKNFRSQKNIIDFSNEILKEVKEFKELVTPMEATIPPGDPVQFYYHDSEEVQFQWVCDEIKSLLYQGYKYSDIFVLFRFNKFGVAFDKIAIMNHIPFELDRGSLINRKCINILLELIYFLLEIQKETPDEDRVFDYMSSFYGEVEDNINIKSFELVHKTYKEMTLLQKLSKIEMLKIKGLGESKKSAFKSFYNKLKGILDVDINNIENVKYLIEFVMTFKFIRKGSLQYFESIKEDFEIFVGVLSESDGESVIDKINKLKIDFTNDDSSADEVPNKVRGLTVHKAKGLENKVVFFINFDNDIIHAALGLQEGEEGAEHSEEEKRVIYVGCTRAMEKMFLSSSGGQGVKSKLIMGSKVLEIDPESRRRYENSLYNFD